MIAAFIAGGVLLFVGVLALMVAKARKALIGLLWR